MFILSVLEDKLKIMPHEFDLDPTDVKSDDVHLKLQTYLIYAHNFL